MRLLTQWARTALWIAAGLCVIPAVVSAQPREKSPADKGHAAAKTANATKAASTTATAPVSDAPLAPAAASAPAPAPPQVTRGSGSDDRTDPEYTRIPSTVGGLGFFTQESGETMPKGSFSFAGYADKFSRMPGHTTVLNLGWNLAIGFHDRFNVLLQWNPYRYLKAQRPNQLSLNAPAGFPLFDNTIYRSLMPLIGTAPGYVEDYPFVNRNDGGLGDIRLGVRLGVAQERLGNPLNMSIGYDFFIPTQTQLADLLDNQTQLGTFSHGPRASASRTWNDWLMSTLDFSYRFTRDHKFGAPTPAFRMADQTRIGIGFLLFPQSRLQIINEYSALIFVREATPNTTFGARDPIDTIAGMRLYFTKLNNLALDAGYRYMLNLGSHGDRHGFVIKLGFTHWGAPPPPPPNNNPSAACTADKTSVMAGSSDSVRVMLRATDADGDPLTYSWTASGGNISGAGAEATWTPGSAPPGVYTVTGRVEDGRGGSASCSVDVRVETRPNNAPTLTCSAERTTVRTGERVRVTGQGSDPDGDNLTYSWQAKAGQIVGSGSSVQWDSTGLAAGSYAVTGRVEDARGGAADCSVQIAIEEPPPAPETTKLNECFFRASSARVDNVCKRILDDVALRLQNDPLAKVAIVGYADPGEPRPDQLATSRASETKKYLTVEKSIADSRVEIRTGTGQAGAGDQNRRVDIIWIPEGATF
ncbi:MAG: Ig-like domain-containing protein [Candidatus Acidiferrales bacterium]